MSNKWCGCTKPINKIHELKKPVINNSGWYLISTDETLRRFEEVIYEYRENSNYELEIHGHAYYYQHRVGKYEKFVSGDWVSILIDSVMNPNLAYWIYIRNYSSPEPEPEPEP
jgi:hypothetical protein